MNPQTAPPKSMVLRVTDPELLEITGGIVQGMSGSPIVQDGRIIGAVTHAVSDPHPGVPGCILTGCSRRRKAPPEAEGGMLPRGHAVLFSFAGHMVALRNET